MNPDQQTANTSVPHAREEEIDLVKYLMLFMRYWKWFLIGLLISMALAFFLNKHLKKIYKVRAALLIEDSKDNLGSQSKNTIGSADIISGFSLFPSVKNYYNQSIILKSASQVEKTICSLDFEVSYFIEGALGRREILNEAPFIVLLDKSRQQTLGIRFKVTINSDSTLTIITEKEDKNIKYINFISGKEKSVADYIEAKMTISFGDTVENEGFSFILLPRPETPEKVSKGGNGWSFSFNSYDDLINKYQKSLELTNIQKEASILELSVLTDCPEKAELFLNMHLEKYLLRTLEKKNLIADNTISFIDKQLGFISDSLKKTEMFLQNFRSANNVIDLSYQGQQLVIRAEELYSRKKELILNRHYFEYLEDYFNNNRETIDLVAPSVMGITDPLLNNLVLSVNTLADQKVAMGGEKSNNPYVATIDMQISNAKATITENLLNIINSNSIAVSDIDSRLSEIMKEVEELPQTERALFSIERSFNLNDNLYTYLLQQKYSAQIAKASNTEDNEIIDAAKVITPHIQPKPTLLYAVALLLGLVIPGSILLLINLINNTITSITDIQHITDLSVSGQIIHNNSGNFEVVLANKTDLVSESFRQVRTKLIFLAKGVQSPIVLLTSAMSGEGKSFTSQNLASAVSLTGKKTVLVDFDLRRPMLSEKLNIENSKGISTYLINLHSIDEIIQESGSDYLWVIPSGPVPPNPSELVASEKTKELFSELKKRFDYIIVDSAPIGIVPEPSLLAQIADITHIMVRHKKTKKYALKSIISEATACGITGMSIILNDVPIEHGYYGYLSDRYGYGKSYYRLSKNS